MADTATPPSIPSPQTIAETFAAFVDVLLPGDDLFPPASTVGIQAMLAERLRQLFGAARVAEIVARINASAPFAAATPEERHALTKQLELEEPQLFFWLHNATVFSYYQHPAVTVAIRALGHDYKDAPQPEGYALPKFDFTPGVNVPMKPKGTFKWTDWLEPVDISGLAHLNLPVRPKG